MTDWIDALAGKLTEDQKRANHQYAVDRDHERLIDEKAPEFFQRLSTAVTEIVNELNCKIGDSLGGVKMDTREGRFVLASQGRIASVSIAGILKAKERQIIVTTTKKGHRFVPGDGSVEQNFRFEIDDQDRLIAAVQKRSFNDPAQMASAILEAAFTDELFRPY